MGYNKITMERKDMKIKHLQMQRYMQNKEIQECYNSLKTYEQKLEFIYQLLKQTQERTLAFKNNEFFTKTTLNDLSAKLKEISNLDEVSFIKFISEKIVKPININIGHVKLDVKTTNSQNEELNSIVQNSDKNIDKKEKLQSENEKNIDKNLTYKMIDDKTLIIKIRSFKKNCLIDDKKIIEEIKSLEKTENFSNVIFDIRGNGGGTDEYSTLFSSFANKDIIENTSYQNTTSNQVDSFSDIIIKKGTGKEYNKFLLVDRVCYSTADSFARIFKKTNFATLVGETTKGEGFGLTPFKCELTSSNNFIKGDKKLESVSLVFPIECPVNEKGQEDFSEFYTEPNIKCNSEMALEVALNHIKDKSIEKNNIEFQM